MEKLYTFNITLPAAQTIINALKELPMKKVEQIVLDLDRQFVEQLKAEQAVAQATDASDIPVATADAA